MRATRAELTTTPAPQAIRRICVKILGIVTQGDSLKLLFNSASPDKLGKEQEGR